MLIKSTLREIKTSLARYLAIFAIVALGVGFFSGLKACKPVMVKAATDYLEELNFFDYEIMTSYGIDDESISTALEWDGVSEAEGSVQIDAMAGPEGGDQHPIRFISMPERINKVSLVEGRLPESEDECVIEKFISGEEGYGINDKIIIADSNDKDTLDRFWDKKYRIVGIVDSPLFLDSEKGTTDIGNGSLYTFTYVMKDAFDMDAYSRLYLKLDGDEASFTPEHETKLDVAKDSMEKLAETLNTEREDRAKREAQEKLDEKRREYEEKLAEYESEKYDAESKLRDGAAELAKGENAIASNRRKANAGRTKASDTVSELKPKLAEVKSGIAALNKEKAKAEAGLAKAESGRAQLVSARDGVQAQIDALRPQADDPAVASQIEALKDQRNSLDKQIDDTDAKIHEIDSGLVQISSKLAEANSARVQIEYGIEQARDGISQADDGLRLLNEEEGKLTEGRAELAKQREKAESGFADAEALLADAREKLDEAQEEIDEMETGKAYAFSRTDNRGYSSFDSNSGIVSNIAKVFPVFFFLIAALVCVTTMTRMIDEQRTQIGVLRALGYSNAQISAKYLFYSGSAAFLGAVIGFFAGCRVFPVVIWHAYSMFYDFADKTPYVLDAGLALSSIAAALLCSMGATWLSMAKDFRAAPSELIRPKTPPAGRRILLERIPAVWSRISFLYKVSIRNIFRDKKRFLMMVIGVSGCTAMLVAATGIRTTVSMVADHQFDEISMYDYLVFFDKNMTEKRQEDFLREIGAGSGESSCDVKFIHRGEITAVIGDKKEDVTCVAADPEDFGKYVDLHSGEDSIEFPGRGEVVISRMLRHDCGADVGDEITLRDGYREMKLKVSGVAENFVYNEVFMSPETYEDGMGRKADIKAAYVKLPEGAGEEALDKSLEKAAAGEYTAAVQASWDIRATIAEMMGSLDAVVVAIVAAAALLAFIVIYNLTNINITERIREIATIKVLGFDRREVSSYVFRENIFMAVAGALAGLPLGKALMDFAVDRITVKMIYFESRIAPTDYVIAAVLTLVFAAGVSLMMRKRLDEVSMTESLKSVE